MLFASFDFLLFFTVAFAGYWALAGRPLWRAVWILSASYFFYMAGPKPLAGPPPAPWYFVGLLLLSTLINYVCGRCIAGARESRPGEPRAGRAWLWLSVVASLGMLAYFKYTGFLLDVAKDAAALLGKSADLPQLSLILPVGISFYTFQSIAYTIDVYRGRIPAERSLLRFALFLAFFPQLVAGPIVRPTDLLPQLAARPSLTHEDVDVAIWRIGKGLLKKVLLADFIAASFTDRVFASPAEHSSLENLLALYAFTLQIYADFSGYSDIAIGAARLLGIRLPENFDRPYQATDIADFWRRWHMTLSSWLRDYVYYPLGGSRAGAGRTYLNLWITMFLVGIWHGAGWNFVIYAILQASALVYHRVCLRSGSGRGRLLRLLIVASLVAGGATLFADLVLELERPWRFGLVGGALGLAVALLPRADEKPWLRPLHVLLTLHFCVLSRVFFRAEDLEAARAMAGKLLSWDAWGLRPGLFANPLLGSWLSETPWLSFAKPAADWFILLLIVAGLAAHYTPSRTVDLAGQRLIIRAPSVFVGMGLAVLFSLLSLLLAGPRANIYFAF